MASKNIVVFENMDQLKMSGARLVNVAISKVLQKQETCRLCLAGGSTPGGVYELLAEFDKREMINLSKVEVLFGDERCVPCDHEDSNYGMAKKSFGKSFNKFLAVRRMEGELENSQTAAANYEQYLKTPIDILLLGVGPDAHIASIFPGSKAFNDEHSLAMTVIGPKPPPNRITITPKVICSAEQTIVFAAGESKSDAISQVFAEDGSYEKLPARLVRDATWLIDKPAASQILPK